MLLVVACYTVCGLSDKYSVAKLKFDGNSFTFLMALPTAVLLLPLMPFSDIHLQLCWQSVLAAVLIMVSKLLEFKMSALVLTEMSAFELKAWLGLCVLCDRYNNRYGYIQRFKTTGDSCHRRRTFYDSTVGERAYQL